MRVTHRRARRRRHRGDQPPPRGPDLAPARRRADPIAGPLHRSRCRAPVSSGRCAPPITSARPSGEKCASRPVPRSRATAGPTACSPRPTTTAITVRDKGRPDAGRTHAWRYRRDRGDARTVFEWAAAPKPGSRPAGTPAHEEVAVLKTRCSQIASNMDYDGSPAGRSPSRKGITLRDPRPGCAWPMHAPESAYKRLARRLRVRLGHDRSATRGG